MADEPNKRTIFLSDGSALKELWMPMKEAARERQEAVCAIVSQAERQLRRAKSEQFQSGFFWGCLFGGAVAIIAVCLC